MTLSEKYNIPFYRALELAGYFQDFKPELNLTEPPEVIADKIFKKYGITEANERECMLEMIEAGIKFWNLNNN
jgi:hypothetical protein